MTEVQSDLINMYHYSLLGNLIMVVIIVTCKVELSVLVMLAQNTNTSVLQNTEVHTGKIQKR